MDGFRNKAMMVMTTRFKISLVLGLCFGLALVGCGRKADLDKPTATPQNEIEATDPAVAASTAIQPTETAEKKGFFLDPLIGVK
ncbi:MAG: hypothetical protein ABJN98_23260 [Roseibium sp.]